MCVYSNRWHHSEQCAQCGALSEPGCCPRKQEQPYPDHDNPDSSRDALAVRCEPFGSNCCRDKSHHSQIHDPDDEEDRRKASAAVSAVEAETQPVPPGRGSIRRQRTLASRWLPATGKVMHLPRAELECASDHDDNTDRDRNDSRQSRPLHFDLGKRRAQWEDNTVQTKKYAMPTSAVSQFRRVSPLLPTVWRYSHSVGTNDGSIIAIIITTHMPTNDAKAPSHVCPGIGIHAIDIVQPPGIGIFPIADMEPHQTVVSAALAAKSSAEVPKNACCEVRSKVMGRDLLSRNCAVTITSLFAVLVVAAPPDARLIATLGGAVEPLICAPETVQSARIGRIGVVDDAVL